MVAPLVSLRGTVHAWATRPPGEGKDSANLDSIFATGRVGKPQRGLGHSLLLLPSTRRLIGTALRLIHA